VGSVAPPEPSLRHHITGARLAALDTLNKLISMKPIVSTRRQFLKRATGLAVSSAVLPSIVQGSAPGMAGEVMRNRTFVDSASILDAVQVRASTLTPVSEEILHFRPSSHWGINE